MASKKTTDGTETKNFEKELETARGYLGELVKAQNYLKEIEKAQKYLDETHIFVFEGNPKDGYTATIPEFPGCISEGKTIHATFDRLRYVALDWIRSTLAKGMKVPKAKLN